MFAFGVAVGSSEADCGEEVEIVCTPAALAGCLQGSEWSASIRKLSFSVCVCVSVSRKGQLRTKSVTHNLRGHDMVPVLFATYLVKNNTYTFSSQTHALSRCSFSDPMWLTVKHGNNTKLTTAETFVVERNVFPLLQDILYLNLMFPYLLFCRSTNHCSDHAVVLTAKIHSVWCVECRLTDIFSVVTRAAMKGFKLIKQTLCFRCGYLESHSQTEMCTLWRRGLVHGCDNIAPVMLLGRDVLQSRVDREINTLTPRRQVTRHRRIGLRHPV